MNEMQNNNKIILVGARIDGQAGVVINTIKLLGKYEVIGFIDNTPDIQGKIINGIPVIGSTNDIGAFKLPTEYFHVCIGDNLTRYKLQIALKKNGYTPISIIHPSAVVSNSNVHLGEGSYIGPNTVINNGTSIGKASIINSGTIIEHDNNYGNAIHLAPGVSTGGRVSISDYSFIGLGSTILPDIKIGSGVLIGAGSTITKNVKNQVTMIGYSAKKFKKNIYDTILPDVKLQQEVYIAQPTLPSFNLVEKRFRDIYDRKMLSNFSENSDELEQIISEIVCVKHALTVPSWTTGLMLVFKALGLTGEVILPSFTFSATGHALIWNNLSPIFADIDPDTFNLDINDVESKITENTSAILGVHIFGNPCDVVGLETLATKYGIKLIYDAAHALGSKYKDKPIGGFGDCEGFSLSGTKMITSAEGGIITSNDSELIKKISMGRNYGAKSDYNCEYIGLNGKMSEFHAALAIESLGLINNSTKNRKAIIALYKERLTQIPGIIFQKVSDDNLSTYKDFGVIIDPAEFGMDREVLSAKLLHEKIHTKKYFYPPLHQMDSYKNLYPEFKTLKLKNTEKVANNIICLPIYSHMNLDTVDKICYTIDRIHRQGI